MNEHEQKLNDHDLLIDLRAEVRGLREEIHDMRDNTIRRLERVESSYVARDEYDGRMKLTISRAEFWPVRAVVYGMTGLILITVLGLIVKGVLVTDPPTASTKASTIQLSN